MKRLLKAILPDRAVTALRRHRRDRIWRQLHPGWDRAVSAVRPPGPAIADPPGNLLIFPADPGGISGSLGDAAMIAAAVAHFRAGCPDLRVSILCFPGEAEQAVLALGAVPVPLPQFAGFPAAMAAILRQGGHDALVCLGADVMDGYYSPEISAEILIAADLAARSGLQAIILGFSFNARAAAALAPCYARLDRRVVVNLREDSSLARLQAFAAVPQARLVADAAFTLLPQGVDAATGDWIRAQKAAGRRVIGINLHPMLLRDAPAAQREIMIAEMAAAIRAASAAAPLSWMLVPHDYRDHRGDGDGLCLRPLFDQLAAWPGLRCHLLEGQHAPAVLKGLTGQLDGVVTGRMHLAVAALGMGVPVMCLTYQDKFEGLFRHFDLPTRFLLPPSAVQQPGALREALAAFLTALPDLQHSVQRARPRVLALAAQNFLPAGMA